MLNFIKVYLKTPIFTSLSLDYLCNERRSIKWQHNEVFFDSILSCINDEI